MRVDGGNVVQPGHASREVIRAMDATSRLVLRFATLSRWAQLVNVVILRLIAVHKAANSVDFGVQVC